MTFLLILLSSISSFVNSVVTKQAINKINAEDCRVATIEKHNDCLWTFVAAIDSCKTLEDIYAQRDAMYDSLCEW